MSAPFIGSRISLISKSDVRYEGILCGIDTNESKVYLQHVRCFGTEDRRKENPIAPATEVYEVIIFHSSDIKDLSVCELPPPVAYDPMSFNSFSPHMGSGYPPQYGYPPMVHPQYGPQYGYPYGPYHNYGMYPQSPSMMGPQDNGAGFPPGGEQGNDKAAPLSVQPPQKINVTTTKVEPTAQPQSSSSSESHPVDNKETNDAQTHNADNNHNDNAKAESTTSDESHSQKSNNFYNKNQNNNQNKRNNNRNNNFVYLPKGEAQKNNQPEKSNDNTNNNAQTDSSSASNVDQQNNRHNNHNNQSDYRQKRGNSNNRGYKSHYNNNRRGGFDSRGHHNSSDQSHYHKQKEQSEPKSQEDFDFLISNSKFEKLSISALPGELEKELPKISPSYNKDSFYDNISCDTLDREDSKDKKSYYEQRKLDSETFGDLGRRTNNNRGRTRGRYDTHSQNSQNNYSGNHSNNQKRYNNYNNNRGNRNYRGNKNTSGNTSNTSDNSAQN